VTPFAAIGMTLETAERSCDAWDAEAMQRLSDYANERGKPEGRPYFSLDGVAPVTGQQYS
jgi:hypothetical protein